MNEVPREPVDVPLGGLWLRQIDERHLDIVVAAFADPTIALWNPLVAEGDDAREAALQWIRRRRDWSSGSHMSWGVFGEADELLGTVSVHRINPLQDKAEIGYWTVPEARRRGVASRAVDGATRFGFERVGMYRLGLTHAVENEPSCRVALKVGYELEGTMRRSFVYGDGQRHDEHLHARLRTDRSPASITAASTVAGRRRPHSARWIPQVPAEQP